MSNNAGTPLTERERIVLLYLSPLMEANAMMIGEELWQACPGKGSNKIALGAAVCGRLRKKGLISRVGELNAWSISRSGREAIDNGAAGEEAHAE